MAWRIKLRQDLSDTGAMIMCDTGCKVELKCRYYVRFLLSNLAGTFFMYDIIKTS